VHRVVVANPGGQIHLKEAAAALAKAAALEHYFSTVGFGPRDIERMRRLLPAPLADRVVRELRRRAVAEDVAGRTTRVATGWEVGNVLLNRSPLPMRIQHAALRPTRLTFDRRVAAWLRPGNEAVVGYQGATTTTFRRARKLGIATVLDYPIAHYAVTESLLRAEARLVPEYARTMRVVEYPAWLRHRYAEEMELADRIVMVSPHHQRTFEAAGIDPRKLFVVPWYVDCELFTPASEVDEGRFRVAFLGQITQRKGISYLIEGFARAGLADAELLLIGAPIGATPWKGKKGVVHVPPMPRFMLPETLGQCHVIVLPSLVEGFPISVLEGMACGLPCIISENIGDDFVQEGVDGFVVPIRDPDAIAERLRELHVDRGRRRRMAVAARAKAERFTQQRYSENLLSGLRQLVDGT